MQCVAFCRRSILAHSDFELTSSEASDRSEDVKQVSILNQAASFLVLPNVCPAPSPWAARRVSSSGWAAFRNHLTWGSGEANLVDDAARTTNLWNEGRRQRTFNVHKQTIQPRRRTCAGRPITADEHPQKTTTLLQESIRRELNPAKPLMRPSRPPFCT